MRVGFPIQRSQDRSLFASSPGLIAGYHVFHRLLAPRHPPYALSSLITPTSDRSIRNRTAAAVPFGPSSVVRWFQGVVVRGASRATIKHDSPVSRRSTRDCQASSSRAQHLSLGVHLHALTSRIHLSKNRWPANHRSAFGPLASSRAPVHSGPRSSDGIERTRIAVGGIV